MSYTNVVFFIEFIKNVFILNDLLSSWQILTVDSSSDFKVVMLELQVYTYIDIHRHTLQKIIYHSSQYCQIYYH